MKLIRAQFKNFRLLRDLTLDFSTDTTKKLTVIRAENETGKTTILNGLQWALYGDDALPEKGIGHRLSPIDWNISENTSVQISAKIDFEITKFPKTRKGDLIEVTQCYRIIRSAHETLNGVKHNRSPATVKLYQLTDIGSEPIDPPEAWIQEEFPFELRELFFTDGDRALSFIEGAVNVRNRRERVRKAIKSLLGLGVIETALKHIENTVREFSKDVGKFESDEKIKKIREELNQIDKDTTSLEKTRDDSKSQSDRLDESLLKIDRKIEEALIKGDREKLVHEFQQTQAQLKQIDKDLTETGKAHSKLFESLSLSRDLIAPVLEKSFGKLAELHNQGKLPRTAVPVLEERLRGTVCICGESLNPQDFDGKHRREHIQRLIEDNRKADELQNSLTDLYYASRMLQSKKIDDSDHWVVHYATISDRQDELKQLREAPAKTLRALEVKIDAIPNTNIQELRDAKRQMMQQRDDFIAKHAECQNQLKELTNRRKSLVTTQNNLMRRHRTGQRAQAKEEVAKDVKSVLEQSYDRITNQELNEVSILMNDLFLEMIGANQEQEEIAIIRKAEISKEFDIRVYGTNDVPLNPDLDLNGASRRALTLAFIIALTKVSHVEGPNVIDTPLGMMSGFVRRSVLKTIVRESSQLILFLTRSEIRECEEILDKAAGKVITLINTTHYPKRLVNNPHISEQMVLRCECNHREECELCRQRIYVEGDIETLS